MLYFSQSVQLHFLLKAKRQLHNLLSGIFSELSGTSVSAMEIKKTTRGTAFGGIAVDPNPPLELPRACRLGDSSAGLR